MTLLPQLLKKWLGTEAITARAVDPAAWQEALANHPFLKALSMPEQERLALLCATLLAEVAVHAAGGDALEETVRVSIAAQACLPVLELGLAAYPRFAEIIVYPGDFVVQREISDEDGVVHEWSESLAGEAWEGGPIILSWDAAAAHSAAAPAFNVVIHEFAHKLDMSNGAMDGVPRLSRTQHAGLDAASFAATVESAYEEFCDALDALEASFPADLDPESNAAQALYATLPLDAYAAADVPEFFSVASECFFTDPVVLRGAYPELYTLFVRYYLQDPARRAAAGSVAAA